MKPRLRSHSRYRLKRRSGRSKPRFHGIDETRASEILLSFAVLSLAALAIAAPTPNKHALEARQSAAVFADTTYNAISISGGQAGNAKAEAAAVFKALDVNNLKDIASEDLTFLNTVNQVANDAEKEVFNPAVEAATGDQATQIQNGKIKNKVLKLMATVLKLQAQEAQGQDVAATLAEETKKFDNNVALDVKAAGQVSIAEPFTATISGKDYIYNRQRLSTMQEHNIQTAPSGPLTWETPELRELYKLYWQVHRPEICRNEVDAYRSSAYDDFYEHNNYFSDSVPSEDEMLNNDIHPIFDKSNWVVGFDDFDEWYTTVMPALQLASMFISHPHMLKFWIHLKYGRPGFENGWVGVVEDPMEHDPDVVEKIKDELLQVARKVKFAFRIAEDMSGMGGMYEPSLWWARSKFEKAAETLGVDYPKGSWYNRWDNSVCRTVFLSVHYYTWFFHQFTPGHKLQSDMMLAKLLVHEMAHACTKMWQPDTCKSYEPATQGSDHFPEADIFLIKQLRGGYWEEYLIVDGEPWPAAHLAQYEGHPLEDEEYTPAADEPAIPTTSADIISRYQEIYAIDVARYQEIEDAKPLPEHCYWEITKLCCPYSQIHSLADNALDPIGAASEEHYYVVHGCKYCWQLPHDVEPDVHPVPYSRRVEPEHPSKRTLFTRKSNTPVRCGLPQKHTALRPAGRSIVKATLEHVDPACVTPALEQLFGEVAVDGEAVVEQIEAVGVPIELQVVQAREGYPRVRTCGLLMMISEPISRLADWLHLP
ncbi:hypothetical protein TUN199_04805 [Pyrenophora tritici-repentis]|nr:hypothetical protein PtrV1_03357 [Pyrenophora tritici-repentis]KAI0588827.1 hypothetical protein Alg130_03204 [Pyrenophora tritici-repentis]KAI0623192.1 hypothetical protein TUN199_04805 [Pyrenophora tritici-repentis]PWO26279.1 UBP5, Ubiquitin C-terminal hydrolase [Pyrenophora tritici-repentis]PZD31880.1 hypothetical protein A1F97_09731 [Pyrenophora tritici-repentis]